jgi:hypothetical protein
MSKIHTAIETTDGNLPDVALVGKMFVTQVQFNWCDATQEYNQKTSKYDKVPGHWNISAQLSDKPERYGSHQTMSIKVEQGVGVKLAEVLLPIIIAEASKKAQALADDSKAMLQALGDRTLACLTNGNQ